jgi:hypothetical protein
MFPVLFGDTRPILATIIAPLLKLLGGGSHASAFLSLVLLHEQTSGNPQ